ncbi:Acetyl-CoA carboxylase, central region [Rhizoctonia solani]|uniref:Acetyl-CoA carboxylase, central region n=1 Tax=Rhizoctonia solani TaxID=456999 RepID=A0A8H7IKT8_9AGAM|nr:Acetyl-CoA carboxylase, central region [Rhizoctonia solani]
MVETDHSKVQHFIGGNSIDTAAHDKVYEHVKAQGGHTVITKILIANNGIAAVKEIRSVRQWCYETFGTERAVEFTVMATPEDLKVNADYIRMADRYVEVPGGTNNNNYANVDLIVDVAERAGVHAVWAGWGHASENPRLPESLAASPHKIVFIGPPGSAMRSLGDKISSTIVAQSADVPTMAWSGSGITDTRVNESGFVEVPDEVYKAACVTSVEEGLDRAEKIGWPVMIKASEGGGGKGIRKVDSAGAFKNAYNAVAGEVPGSPIFIMKLAGSARHLEIIEEAPVSITKRERFEDLERAAVRLAKLVGYVSAGTVEYLYSPSEDLFYFLELNPRLQVEHPTTEMVTGVNLPAAQLQIAMGIPLHHIRDIRQLYGLAPHGTSEIDFDLVKPESNQLQRKPQPKGHVVAVRITAENPDAGFKPSSGTLQELNFRSNTNVWGYFSVGSAGGLHEFADSQFGHIFAYGADREESRKNMVVALKELNIRGDFRTTVEYLIKLLQTQAFTENTFTTGWLDTLISNNLTAERPDSTLAVICGAVMKAHVMSEACWAEYRAILDKGQVPARDTLKTVFGVDFIYENTRYSFTAARSSLTTWTLYLNGGRTMVGARPLADGGLLVLLDGKSHSVYWREEVGAVRVMVDSKTCLIEQENDPTQLRSPSPGKLIRFLVDTGDHVRAGEPYAEIEVMKMLMQLIASEDGTVMFVKQPGVSLEPGDIIGILTLDDPARVKHAKPFDGLLPAMGPPNVIGSKPHQPLLKIFLTCFTILNYHSPNALQLSSLSGRLPSKLEDAIRAAIDTAHAKPAPQEFPAARVRKLLDNHLQENVRAQDRPLIRAQFGALFDIVDRYRNGIKIHEWSVIIGLLQRYESTEKLFGGGQFEEKVLKLRDQYKTELDKVAALVLSHSKAQSKNKLVSALLDEIQRQVPGPSVGGIDESLNTVLRSIAALESRSATQVALKAREVLIRTQQPSYEERSSQMEQILTQSVRTGYYGEQGAGHRQPSAENLRELTDSRFIVYDVLPTFFTHKDRWISLAAMDVYVRRAYRAYNLISVDYEEGDDLDDGDAPNIVVDAPKRSGSVSDLTYIVDSREPIRTGTIATFPNFDVLLNGFKKVAEQLPHFNPDDYSRRHGQGVQPPNVLYFALRVFVPSDDMEDAAWREKLLALVNNKISILNERGIRRVTFLICRPARYPWYFTMRDMGNQWGEEEAIRNIEPALAYQLELSRLSNFKLTPCFVDNQQIHVYHAVARENQFDSRFFIRALVRPGRLRGNMRMADYLLSETDRLVGTILDALEVVGSQHRNTDCNHIALNFVYNLSVTYEEVVEAIAGFIERHGKRLWRLHVTGAEIRIVLEDEEGNISPLRCVIENVSGFIVNYFAYQEIMTDKGTKILKTIGTEKGPLHLQPVHYLYPTKESLQPKRYQAHIIGTTYVYDFPDLFMKALHNLWIDAKNGNPNLVIPKKLLQSRELVLDENDELQEVDRAPGITHAVWLVGYLPYIPRVSKGSRAGRCRQRYHYARQRGLPRIYLSANSGARIGLAEEALSLFSCAWNDKDRPEQGVSYLYLTPENHAKLNEKGAGSVLTTQIEDEGETRFKITDVNWVYKMVWVAYDDIFTITLVTARSVGIGAYLVRLGQRAVQVEGQPIILTGAPALNKVLGREVYTSNLQLGGTQIMHKNGVSHLTAASDLEGATHILRWLSFIPERKGAKLPITTASDPWDRDIEYTPPKGPYDPRWFVEGKVDEATGEFLSGFFDKKSFQETLSGWAQTVVVGRARLAGIPVGVISVETRTIERIIPADPANPASFEQRIMEAGQVWYPNSAYKTAQAIFDFNREGLPLIVFANWRGFSGGQQDMYDEVLKQGSKIVDGLSSYKQPIFVYIVPNGELRGGAWVVLDPSINSEQMEMYADVDARAGVLEPEGIVEIKMRRERLLALMERLDDSYSQLKTNSKDSTKTAEERAEASRALAERETLLMPTYKQIALLYADLHDRTGRMAAKGCAQPVVWKDARRHFYWALRARLARNAALAVIAEASPESLPTHRTRLLESLVPSDIDHNDKRKLAEALEALDLTTALSSVRHAEITHKIVELSQNHRKATLEGILRVIDTLTDEEKVAITGALHTSSGGGPPSYSHP